jgi:hypothetical protein
VEMPVNPPPKITTGPAPGAACALCASLVTGRHLARKASVRAGRAGLLYLVVSAA